MASIFSKIIAGQIPSYKIAEDDQFFAFLDIMPVTAGHTLVVPKQEIDYIFDLEDELLAGLHVFSKKIAIALKKAIVCQRISTVVIGLEVPHTHIHLIPINSMQDMDFSKKKEASAQELEQTAKKIITYL